MQSQMETGSLLQRKLVVVGDGGCGKTCFLHSYVKNEFPEEYVPTLFENHVSDIVVDGQQVTLSIWDSTGQENLASLRVMGYADVSVIMVAYSIGSPSSLQNVEDQWVGELHQHCPGVPIVLVGLKSDLRSNIDVLRELALAGESPVSEQQGRDVARKIGAVAYVECSARLRENIAAVFEAATRATMKRGVEHSKAAEETSAQAQPSLLSYCPCLVQ
ncbi:ras family-domain-containing protein [Chytriomyces cf. hyalinus JEL632]|nr:ras family-domain-containing protein [Chytriomyces cf. hyalinus JEL632]